MVSVGRDVGCAPLGSFTLGRAQDVVVLFKLPRWPDGRIKHRPLL